MASALIGHSGFVGGNLATQHRFDDTFNSSSIAQIVGRAYDTLVVSGAPAAKWIANRDPEADIANLRRLMDCLDGVRADHVILVSTIDVYPEPVAVDERTVLDPRVGQPYGRHRLMLERFVQERFDDVTVVRLPGLFGPGLKKNIIYDFLHGNDVHKIHCDSVFQFYDTTRLWADIQRVRSARIDMINIATEPVSVGDVAREAFGVDFVNRPDAPPATYDVRTVHAHSLCGGDRYLSGYLSSRRDVLDDLRRFVAVERGRSG
jgi:nucleoside-diphosphate-sugar epimerase